ncbi:MAG: lysoplasmalogenase [Treponema sp.]|nr:lysoplasmalogenase [Treponema sp.]
MTTLIIEFSCAAVCIFLILVFKSGNRRLWLLPVAFILSFAGDVFMGRRSTDINYIYGILFYFMAHICFSLYALWEISKGRLSWPVLAAVTVPYLVFYFAFLLPSPRLNENLVLAAAVLLYLLISCFALTASVNFGGGLSVSWIFTAGILCLLFSDTIIALGDFVRYRRLSFMVMPLFHASHILIVISVTLKSVLHRNAGER